MVFGKPWLCICREINEKNQVPLQWPQSFTRPHSTGNLGVSDLPLRQRNKLNNTHLKAVHLVPSGPRLVPPHIQQPLEGLPQSWLLTRVSWPSAGSPLLRKSITSSSLRLTLTVAVSGSCCMVPGSSAFSSWVGGWTGRIHGGFCVCSPSFKQWLVSAAPG